VPPDAIAFRPRGFSPPRRLTPRTGVASLLHLAAGQGSPRFPSPHPCRVSGSEEPKSAATPRDVSRDAAHTLRRTSRVGSRTVSPRPLPPCRCRPPTAHPTSGCRELETPCWCSPLACRRSGHARTSRYGPEARAPKCRALGRPTGQQAARCAGHPYQDGFAGRSDLPESALRRTPTRTSLAADDAVDALRVPRPARTPRRRLLQPPTETSVRVGSAFLIPCGMVPDTTPGSVGLARSRRTLPSSRWTTPACMNALPLRPSAEAMGFRRTQEHRVRPEIPLESSAPSHHRCLSPLLDARRASQRRVRPRRQHAASSRAPKNQRPPACRSTPRPCSTDTFQTPRSVARVEVPDPSMGLVPLRGPMLTADSNERSGRSRCVLPDTGRSRGTLTQRLSGEVVHGRSRGPPWGL
jgi:hypothetical protein